MRRRLFLAGGVISVLLVAGAAAYFLTSKSKTDSGTNSRPTTAAQTQEPKNLTASYLLSGDVFWGRGIDYYAQRTSLKYAWPFSGLKLFHPENYDGWISDMECPITNITVPYQTQVDKLILQCPPAYTPEAAKYFTAFTLANNHTENTGAQGFADTRANLEKNGIQYFGHYDPSVIKDICEVVSLPANAGPGIKDGRFRVKLPVAMCGYHWLNGAPNDEELAQITKFAKYFPVWVFPHGGTEYATHHSDAQQALYREFIDRGADAVFGDHPHVIEDTEAYKGKLISYDFGNLIYDQWFDDEVTKSLIINASISTPIDSNLQAYLDMGKSCAAFQDDCLAKAEAANLHAPKLKYSYKITAGDSNNASIDSRIKRPGSPAVQNWLLKRTNWAETLKGLDQSTQEKTSSPQGL